jgi:hypothetical protein
MPALIDFRGEVPMTSEDQYGLLAYARQLIGEKLLFARRGYLDELRLHFGTPIERRGAKGRTIISGSYLLGAVASEWEFKIAGKGIIESEDKFPSRPWSKSLTEADLDRFLAAVGGQVVENLTTSEYGFAFSLQLYFQDGSFLKIDPTRFAEEEEGNSPPDWELFTPYKRYLRVGPGWQWGYLRSDRPESPSP